MPWTATTARSGTRPADRRVDSARGAGLGHAALFYRDDGEFFRGLTDFLGAARAATAPVQVALPGQRIETARRALGMLPGQVSFCDMVEAGRNPSRLIPAAQSFADKHAGRSAHFLWEPAWPSRSAAEQREIVRHESLVNLAFGDRAMTVLCLYDAAALSPRLIEDAELTHPVVIAGGRRRVSPDYLGPGEFPTRCDGPLPPPVPGAESMSFTDELGLVREFSARHADQVGLSPSRARDLVLAVSEIAGNAVGHADGGVLRAWRSDGELICQIEDGGHIADPLAGRGGHGLWLVNRVCDLVERRTSPAGTTTRLHMRIVP